MHLKILDNVQCLSVIKNEKKKCSAIILLMNTTARIQVYSISTTLCLCLTKKKNNKNKLFINDQKTKWNYIFLKIYSSELIISFGIIMYVCDLYYQMEYIL